MLLQEEPMGLIGIRHLTGMEYINITILGIISIE